MIMIALDAKWRLVTRLLGLPHEVGNIGYLFVSRAVCCFAGCGNKRRIRFTIFGLVHFFAVSLFGKSSAEDVGFLTLER